MKFTQLDENMFVSPQIDADGVRAAAAQGIRVIINNRPDHEGPGQPLSADLAEVAQACGVEYHPLPIDHSGFPRESVDAMVMLLSKTEAPMLGFCRTGTRSTFLWALARRKFGDSYDDLQAKAQAAGYDLGPIKGLM